MIAFDVRALWSVRVNRTRGLTLVELVVTMCITLILASAAIGGLLGVQSWRAARAAARLAADLSYARAYAMLTERRTLCTFDLPAQSYRLDAEPSPSTGALIVQPMRHPLTGENWEVQLAELGGLRITDLEAVDDGALGFGPDGLPLRASGSPIKKDVRISLSNGAQILVFGGSGVCQILWSAGGEIRRGELHDQK